MVILPPVLFYGFRREIDVSYLTKKDALKFAGIISAIILINLYLFLVFVPYHCHVDMVKSHTHEYGYSDFNHFKKEFDKYNWRTEGLESSLFDSANNCQIHADIIEFNDVGMIMKNQIEYIRVKMFIWNYLRALDKNKPLHEWK